MRILLSSPYDLTRPGGVTSHVFDLAEQFQQMEHEVVVAGPAGNGPLIRNGFTQHLGGTVRFPSPGDSAYVNLAPWISGRVRELLNAHRFDVLHLHEPFLGFMGASFARFGEGVKVGTFHTSRNGPHIPYIAFGPLVRRWNRYLHGRIAVSESARTTIKRYVKGDFRLIPNGIDFERFAMPLPPPAHLSDNVPTILFVGRIESRKGIPYLLRAFRYLKHRRPDTRLVIVGEGSLRHKYEHEAVKLGLCDVHFEGHVSAEILPAYFQRADVFASPSTMNESFGITLLESMAARTPAVATSINGVNTLGEHGVTGLIVPPKDAEAMANAIDQLLGDRATAASYAEAAQARAREFDWRNVAIRMLDYYEELGA